MQAFTIAITAMDSALGRFNAESLSDQQRMELFVQDAVPGFMGPDFYDADGAFLPIEDWRCTYIDGGQVSRISLIGYSGTFVLSYLPAIIKEVCIEGGCTGTLETETLPKGLINLRIRETCFGGEVDFTRLPQALQNLNIEGNLFLGSVDLQNLPKSMETFIISRNDFDGSLALDALPPSLKRFCADENNFSGAVVLNALPVTLSALHLSKNKLCGKLNLLHLPPGIKELDLSSNRFEGPLELVYPLAQIITIDVSFNKLSGAAIVHSSMQDRVQCSGNLRMTMILNEEGE